MKKIATLNKISPVGLRQFSDDYNIVDDIDEASGIIVRSADMHGMNFSDNLLAIARAGAGYNNIPIDKCAENGIVVFNAPGANSNAVKELVICAMIACARNLFDATEWVSSIEEDVLKTVEKGKKQFSGSEIKGKTIGVIGLGAIGVLVANQAQSLGMKVVGYDPFISLHSAHALSNTIPVAKNLEALLSQSDYVTLHIPVTDDTKGMIDSRRFSQMKDGAVLMNFARNTLISEDSLIEALSEGKLKKYITDFATDRLIGNKGVLAIPHLGASTSEAEDNCATMAATQLMDYIENGNITNSVNYPACSMGPLKDDVAGRLCILNKNERSAISQMTNIIADMDINIRDMINKSRGDYACTLLDIDEGMTEDDVKKLRSLDGILRVRFLK